MNEEKRFDEWNILKNKIHVTNKKPIYHEREVWWCTVGENIQIEINGKDEHFSRPVLIVRKYGNDGFFGIPLSSKGHEGIWYANFNLRGVTQCALLSQARTYSSCRLYDKMGRINVKDFDVILKKLQKLLFKNNIPQSL